MMGFIEHTPAISDDDLHCLLANARRIERTGDAMQKAAAAELLPAVQELLQARQSLRDDMEEARRAAARGALH